MRYAILLILAGCSSAPPEYSRLYDECMSHYGMGSKDSQRWTDHVNGYEIRSSCRTLALREARWAK